jgi:hypothetical protein
VKKSIKGLQMNKVMNVLLALLVMSASVSALAENFRVQRVKTLGPMKHKVIFQGKDLRKVKGTNLLKGKIVARWGVHVYEVASAFYTCNTKNYCRFSAYERVATFEKCEVVNKNKVQCRYRIAGDTYSSDDSRDVISYENPDEVYDEYGRPRDHHLDYPEFPVRVPGEFDDSHL